MPLETSRPIDLADYSNRYSQLEEPETELDRQRFLWQIYTFPIFLKHLLEGEERVPAQPPYPDDLINHDLFIQDQLLDFVHRGLMDSQEEAHIIQAFQIIQAIEENKKNNLGMVINQERTVREVIARFKRRAFAWKAEVGGSSELREERRWVLRPPAYTYAAHIIEATLEAALYTHLPPGSPSVPEPSVVPRK